MRRNPGSTSRETPTHVLVEHVEGADFKGVPGPLRNMREWQEIKRRLALDWAAIPQALYDSEINFSIKCQWDGGWLVRLGDDDNGWSDEVRIAPPLTFDIALCKLAEMAVKAYPNSVFARSYMAKTS